LSSFLCAESTGSGQTTVDFWANAKKRRALRRLKDRDRDLAKATGQPIEAGNSSKYVFVNPYDLGVRRNFERVFGREHWLVAILPSTRLPPWPPFETVAGAMARERRLAANEARIEDDVKAHIVETGGVDKEL